MGPAPGEDGMIEDIFKTAAYAVNNNNLIGDNTVAKKASKKKVFCMLQQQFSAC
jgi:hypothetical protein